jgi:hypothetical protein
MTILSSLIQELETDDFIEQLLSLCTTIEKEELHTIHYPSHLPQGPNIFLSLEVPGRTTKEIGFLTLERESHDLFILGFYTLPYAFAKDSESSKLPKRIKIWEVEEHRPEKILTEYAKKYKFLRGE